MDAEEVFPLASAAWQARVERNFRRSRLLLALLNSRNLDSMRPARVAASPEAGHGLRWLAGLARHYFIVMF